jgi:Escherichia/Staphylococcus phage prohead protease
MFGLEYKRIPFELKAVDDDPDGGWQIAGYASTFWGSPDFYGDVVAPGAFAASIAERPTKFLFEHSIPIGKQLELREDEHGLYGRWSVVDTTTGTDAYKLAKAGVLDSLSIGYFPDDVEFLQDGTRVLRAVTLIEVSVTATPANVDAVVTAVKRAYDERRTAAEAAAPDPAPVAETDSDPLCLDFEAIRRRLERSGILEPAS